MSLNDRNLAESSSSKRRSFSQISTNGKASNASLSSHAASQCTRVNEQQLHAAKRIAVEQESVADEGCISLFIFVKLMTGISMGIHVNEDDTVGSLLTRIAEESKIPKSDHVLIYRGRKLDGRRRVREYGIERNSTVYVSGRLRSVKHLEMWRVVDDMVSAAIKLCKGESDNDGRLDSAVRCGMDCFLKGIENSRDVMKRNCLDLFMSLSAADALANLCISLDKDNVELGAYVGRLFFEAVEEFDEDLQAHAALSVLQFCKHLRIKDSKDAFYCDCRRTLSLIFSSVVNSESDNVVESSFTWQEVLPFVIEMGNELTYKLTASLESSTLASPTLADVQDFHLFLTDVLNCLQDTVNFDWPISMSSGVLEYPFSEQLQSLYLLFGQLFDNLWSCLNRADHELSRDDCEDNILDHVGDAYFLLLKALDEFSKMFDGAEEILWESVQRKTNIVCVLLIKYAVKNADDIKCIDWLLEHKEVLDFECRTYLARMILPLLLNHDQEILIHRSWIFADSFRHIAHANPVGLRTGFSLKFQNEEANGPGVLREWFLLVCQEIFSAKKALFISNTNDHRRFYINPASMVEPRHLNYFRFCGRVIALALMHGMQIGILLDRVLFVQLAGHEVQLEDIKDTDPITYRSCKQILDMDADLVDSDSLELYFVTEYEELGTRKTVELIPGGGSIKVNRSNRSEYIDKLIHYRFQTSTSTQLASLSEGFTDIMWNPNHMPLLFQCVTLEDLDRMLCGSESDISVEDWKAHTDYKDYKDSDPQIIWFWKIVGEMSPEDRRQFLYFWTAIKYVPIVGFSGIDPRLEIQKAKGSSDHLPTSHTCFNLFSLPKYSTYKIMQQKISVLVKEYVASSFGIS